MAQELINVNFDRRDSMFEGENFTLETGLKNLNAMIRELYTNAITPLRTKVRKGAEIMCESNKVEIGKYLLHVLKKDYSSMVAISMEISHGKITSPYELEAKLTLIMQRLDAVFQQKVYLDNIPYDLGYMNLVDHDFDIDDMKGLWNE